MSADEDILITGAGVFSPLGNGLAAFDEALFAGRPGISWREGWEGSREPVAIAGHVRDFDGRQLIKPRKAIKVMCQEIQFGHAAAITAIESSGSAASGDRAGVVYGAETYQTELEEARVAVAACTSDGRFDFSLWGEKSMHEIQPLWMLKYLPNMVASHISIALGATGPNNTICQDDVSSTLAIIEAATLVRRGWVDVAIAGGTGSRALWHCQAGRRVAALSHGWESPEEASRPFHPLRNGYVAGEGGAAIVLERGGPARQRGAAVLGRLAGWASGFCPPPAAASSLADVIVRIIEEALSRGATAAREVAVVSAHGQGTIREDCAEALALRTLLPDVPVFALKSLMGNAGAANGAIEAIAALLALSRQMVPPTANTAGLSGDAPVNASTNARPLSGSRALSLAIAPSGQIAALLFAAD